MESESERGDFVKANMAVITPKFTKLPELEILKKKKSVKPQYYREKHKGFV